MKSSNSANDAVIDRLTRTIPPMDVAVGERLLREAKQIMDRLGVVFFLRQGTCLGAVRDHAFIPWDDDLDLGIVIGLHGFTEQSIGPIIAAFRDSGYYVGTEPSADNYRYFALLKQNMRIDLIFYWIIDGEIYHYPGVWLPVRLFSQLKEIDFIGEKFLVPSPPEEYLRLKYGPDWVTPKRIGYEKDVLDNIQEGLVPRRHGALRRFLTRRLLPWRATRLRILDNEGQPVRGAEVAVVGLGRSRTDQQGYVKLYPPRDDCYALTVRYDSHEEVLYEEQLAPGGAYVYKPDSSSPAGRIFTLSRQ